MVTLDALLDPVAAALVELHRGDVAVHARRRMDAGGTRVQYIGAWVPSAGYVGMKFSVRPAGSPGHGTIVLFSADTGALVAAIEAHRLSRLRTAAATALGTRQLAREDASVAALIGTGRIAPLQAAALPAVRDIREIRVCGRDAGRTASFAAELAASLDVDVRPCDTVEAAVRGADIVVTATTAVEPLIKADWLAPGTHINAVGSNHPEHRELDGETVGQAEVIAVDSLVSAREEAGDLIMAAAEGALDWDRAVHLGAVISGDAPGRQTADGITIFKSCGVAVEDVAGARLVLDALARENAAVDDPAV